MTFSKIFLSALVAAGVSAASSCSVAATTTITNSAQAASIAAACQTFTGNIALATDASGAIDFSGIQEFQNGGLYAANNAQLSSLSSSTLSTINGQFYLQNVTQLNALSFPMLTSVQTLHWESLASLYGWTLNSGIQDAVSVLISNTPVTTLDGLDLVTVNDLTISDNRQLQNITMQLANATGTISISQNGEMPTVEFPDLKTALNIYYTGVSTIDLSGLETVNGTLGIYESSLSTVDLAKLTTIGGLTILNSPQVTNFSVPKLTLVTKQITFDNDTGLTGTIAFPSVTAVRGAVRIQGSFTSVSMPSVTYVGGTFMLRSSKNIDSTCSHFSGVHGIQGQESCQGGTTSTPISGTPGSTPSPTTGGTAAASSSTGAAATMGATPMVGGLLGLFLAILGML